VIGQLYYLPPTADNLENAAPGQFVYGGDDDDFVRGFIVEVTMDRLILCLWEPKELPDAAVVLANRLDQDTMYELLEGALKKNPSMRKHWASALANSPTEH
jgi:hypothetical protein